jgi:type II secretory pathway pseudopilin PulG
MLCFVLMKDKDIEMNACKSYQKGSSMIEMLGVLGIIAVLSISAIKVVSNGLDVLKQNLVVTQLRNLQKNISERYNLEGNYQTLLESKNSAQVAEALCTQKLAPYDMCFSDSDGSYSLVHRLGGDVIVEAESAAFTDSEIAESENYERYALVANGLSDRTCINAAQVTWSSKQKDVLYRMAIKGGTENQKIYEQIYNQTDDTSTFPVKINDIMAACSKGRDNSIIWVFY